jgi:DNA-binding transcriptional ArsR family regulator
MNNEQMTIPMETLERSAQVLRVLAHPHRLKIVECLDLKRCTVGELTEQLGLAPNAVSQHLNFMKAHGILDSQRVGRNVYYRVVHPSAITLLNCIRKHACGIPETK